MAWSHPPQAFSTILQAARRKGPAWRRIHGTRTLLGQRQPILLARAAGTRIQGRALRVARIAVLQAGAQVAADAAHESARSRARAQGRRFRGVSSRSPACFTSTASIPDQPLFGTTPEEAATIMRVICEYQAYAESHVTQIVSAVFLDTLDENMEEVTRAMHLVAGEARTHRRPAQHVGLARRRAGVCGRCRRVSEHHVAAACDGEARGGRTAFPVPAHGRDLSRPLPDGSSVSSGLPGYDRTYPPHWRDGPPRG